jgi:hypothetical protein
MRARKIKKARLSRVELRKVIFGGSADFAYNQRGGAPANEEHAHVQEESP